MVPDTDSVAAYRAAYTRGWRASGRYVVSRDGSSPLERADDRGEPNAWYDGYDDHAAGRPMWEGREGAADDGPCPCGRSHTRGEHGYRGE